MIPTAFGDNWLFIFYTYISALAEMSLNYSIECHDIRSKTSCLSQDKLLLKKYYQNTFADTQLKI